jgi:hypothetical protein
MKEGTVHPDIALPAHHQTAKISAPGKRPFHLPAALIAPQFSPVLQWRLLAVLAMRTDQIAPAFGQALMQSIRIACLVINEPLWFFAEAATTIAGHSNRLKRRLHQLYLSGGRRFQEVSQRKTFAVDLHQPLRAFAPLGFPDTGPPFFAGAKLPSAKASDQSSWPWASNWPRKAHQALSQMSCFSSLAGVASRYWVRDIAW